MPRYSYRARNSDGKLVEGQVDAGDRAAAIQLIEQKRCVPIRIEAEGGDARPAVARANGTTKASAEPASGLTTRQAPATPPAVRPAAPTTLVPAAGGVRLSHGQRLFFTEQLAYLLTVGMTLDEALGILGKRLKQPALQQLTAVCTSRSSTGAAFPRRCASTRASSPRCT